MCPQLPRLSPEYSQNAGLQTVITGIPLQIRHVTRGGHAGPVTMGRNARGRLSWTRPHCGMPSSPVFVWCRLKRRASLPALSLSEQRLSSGDFERRVAFLPSLQHPAWRPRPTRHVTGALVTTYGKPHCHLRQCRASSTAESVPRLETTLRTAQQCQPGALVTGQSAAGEGATVDMAKSGPAVMAAADGRKQQSKSAGSRPLLEQQGSPLPRREDDAPVFCSSNGSHNGCPANHSSRRINSAAGQATPLAGEAGDASPPP
jgi:hypothetical protein